MLVIKIANEGEMKFNLDEENAPITVENFKKLVNQNFYNGLIFHRIIKDFMIQGGDPEGTGMGGSKENIKGEFKNNGVANNHQHIRGTISMARAQNPNSASSQFFICHKDCGFLDGDYAAFGDMVEGFEILDRLASVPTNFRDYPIVPPVIEKMYFED